MKSYLSSPTLKKRFVAEIEKHRKADQIEQGNYGRQNGQWKGCAVACSLRSLAIIDGQDLVTEYSRHADYETKLGIPEWLARLEDTIFEGLPKKEAMLWPTAFAKAVPVGKDLNPIKWKFCAFILSRNIERVLTLNIENSLKKQVVDAIRGVLDLHEKAIRTGKWDESAASAAASAASAAASAAARSAASAAASAARSAASAASAAASAEWSAEWSAEYLLYSKHLLKLIKATK
jgi:hypothetical protein